jgi:hypothetical protein
MDQPFDSDLMEDFAADSPPASADDMFDAWAEDDLGNDAFYNQMDGFESGDVASSYTDDGFADEAIADFGSEYDEASYDEGNASDAMEDAVVDALGAEDADEFLQRFRQVADVARRIGRGVGQAARAVAPIASTIPLPQAQAIGRIASVAGRLLFEGADEFEALDAVLDLAEQEEAIDAALPVIAGLTIRSVMPRVARAPRPVRQQLVRSVSQSTRLLVRRQGPQAARAIAPVVQSVQRTAQQRRLPAQQLPQAVRQAATRVAANPRLARQLVQRQTRSALLPLRQTRLDTALPRRLMLQGPVEILIRTR